MKITLFMVMSVNGFIADKNGNEDFLSDENWDEFVSHVKEKGYLLWGRKTYETVLSWQDDSLKDLKGIKKYVLSSKRDYKVGEDFHLVSSPTEFVKKLSDDGIEEAVVSGG